MKQHIVSCFCELLWPQWSLRLSEPALCGGWIISLSKLNLSKRILTPSPVSCSFAYNITSNFILKIEHSFQGQFVAAGGSSPQKEADSIYVILKAAQIFKLKAGSDVQQLISAILGVRSSNAAICSVVRQLHMLPEEFHNPVGKKTRCAS